MIVDVIKCASCLGRLERTARMVTNGTRHHAGRCAALATAETRWRSGDMGYHMHRMRLAAARTRTARMHKRLAAIAPGVPAMVRVALYQAGYKAGNQAKQRGF